MMMKLYSCQHPMDEEAPGPCAWCEGNLRHTMKCLTEERDDARAALKVALHHLNDQSDPFATARNLIKVVLEKVAAHEEGTK